jgi:DNA mismatch repair protein MutH
VEVEQLRKKLGC